MTKSTSHHRPMPGQSSPRDPLRTVPTVGSKPLPAAEIEALLQLARENSRLTQTNSQAEESGPGDVQYLRGDSASPTSSKIGAALEQVWPDANRNPDAALAEMELRIAEAIMKSGLPTSATAPLLRTSVPNAVSATPVQGLQLEDLGDIDLDISIELGRAEILIEDVLKLREGSVVSLDKLAGDPVDIVANGRLVARGELLVIDGKFGVRLSEVL
jgi:flagellar motor switch protein FliN